MHPRYAAYSASLPPTFKTSERSDRRNPRYRGNCRRAKPFLIWRRGMGDIKWSAHRSGSCELWARLNGRFAPARSRRLPDSIFTVRQKNKGHVHMAAVSLACLTSRYGMFGTFTSDLHDLADRFSACGVTSVAMKSNAGRCTARNSCPTSISMKPLVPPSGAAWTETRRAIHHPARGPAAAHFWM